MPVKISNVVGRAASPPMWAWELRPGSCGSVGTASRQMAAVTSFGRSTMTGPGRPLVAICAVQTDSI